MFVDLYHSFWYVISISICIYTNNYLLPVDGYVNVCIFIWKQIDGGKLAYQTHVLLWAARHEVALSLREAG